MEGSPKLFQVTFRPRNQISKSRNLGRERRGRRLRDFCFSINFGCLVDTELENVEDLIDCVQ
jgi:hypothetical protein